MSLLVIFFSLYLLTTILIGILSSRKETEEDFMIAGRKVAGLQLISTLSAGFFDGATLAIYTAYVYQYGMSALWYFIGVIFGFLILAKYVPKIKVKADELQVYSMSEYFYRVFDKRNGILFSVFILIEYLSLLIVNLIIAGKIFSAVFPVSYGVGVLVGSMVIISYLLLAGFKAVVKTDFFQMAIMFIMAFSVAAFLAGKSSISLSELSLTNAGLSNTVAFLVIGALLIVIDPAVWQRMFAAKDEQALKNSLFFAPIVLLLLAVSISIVGLVTKQLFPGLAPENALVYGFNNILPFGFKELGIVLLYAVSLSSSDTLTFVISSMFTRDLKNYTTRFSQESMKRMTRLFIFLCLLVVTVAAIFYQDIMTLGFSLSGVVIALVPAVIGSLYWTLDKKAVFWSLLLGLATIVILFVADSISPNTVIYSLPVSLLALIAFQFLARSGKNKANVIISAPKL